MDWRLEVVILPVGDIDRAKDFYVNGMGFHCDVDYRAGESFRVVQLTPPGSAASVTLMTNPAAAGSVQGLHLVVSDIERARAELIGRGVAASDFFHFDAGQQRPGLEPNRASYGSFFSVTDPDGTGWLIQEVSERS